MPDPKKDKEPEEELDAVSAAYESISKKLEELRKKREEDTPEETEEPDEENVSDETDDQPADEDEAADEVAIAEPDVEVPTRKSPGVTEIKAEKELEPLPGTEETDQDDSGSEDLKEPDEVEDPDEEDPLDREDVTDEEPQGDHDLDDFEEAEQVSEAPAKADPQAEEPAGDTDDDAETVKQTFVRPEPTLTERARQTSIDEMEQWEKVHKKGEAGDQVEQNPGFTTKNIDSETAVEDGQPDSLDDLASEPLNAPLRDEGSRPPVRREAPTQHPDFDEMAIRQIRPHHPVEQQDEYDNRPPQREAYDNFRRDEQDPYSRRGRRKTGIWQLLVLGLIGLGVIGGTVYFLKFQFNDNPQPSPSTVVENPTPTPAATATPVPAPQIDRSKYKVRVLNGTTTTGMAASVSAKLKGLGFQTERTGNATNSAFERTVVRVKEGSQSSALLETLVKDIAPEFDSAGTPDLKSNDAVDIEIILGKK